MRKLLLCCENICDVSHSGCWCKRLIIYLCLLELFSHWRTVGMVVTRDLDVSVVKWSSFSPIGSHACYFPEYCWSPYHPVY